MAEKTVSLHTKLSLAELALGLGIQPNTAQMACQRAKAKASRSTDRVYFECKGHILVWYKPE
jgi:DNA-binding CsgD family transcriptional regulator